MCFSSELLKPINQCNNTAIESPFNSPLKCVKIYKDSQNRLRLVYYKDSKPLCGLLLEFLGKRSGYIIKGVYTASESRRMGLARQLLVYSRLYCGKVRHSDNLTAEGKAWRDSVEGIID